MNRNFLNEVIGIKKTEVEKAKSRKSLSALKSMCEEKDLSSSKDFFNAVSQSTPPRIIAECKKQSPSRGLLKENYDPLELALSFVRAGAVAISVLTEESFFGGCLEDLHKVSESISIPCLRKDFIIDEYQVYEARRFGAASYLLLASLHDAVALQYLIEVGRDLGMEALVEVHNEEELQSALKTDAKIIGINNRDLTSLRVNENHAMSLLSSLPLSLRAPGSRCFIWESGIKTSSQIQEGEQMGFSAFLVGEHLMGAQDPAKMLLALRDNP